MIHAYRLKGRPGLNERKRVATINLTRVRASAYWDKRIPARVLKVHPLIGQSTNAEDRFVWFFGEYPGDAEEVDQFIRQIDCAIVDYADQVDYVRLNNLTWWTLDDGSKVLQAHIVLESLAGLNAKGAFYFLGAFTPGPGQDTYDHAVTVVDALATEWNFRPQTLDASYTWRTLETLDLYEWSECKPGVI